MNPKQNMINAIVPNAKSLPKKYLQKALETLRVTRQDAIANELGTLARKLADEDNAVDWNPAFYYADVHPVVDWMMGKYYVITIADTQDMLTWPVSLDEVAVARFMHNKYGFELREIKWALMDGMGMLLSEVFDVFSNALGMTDDDIMNFAMQGYGELNITIQSINYCEEEAIDFLNTCRALYTGLGHEEYAFVELLRQKHIKISHIILLLRYGLEFRIHDIADTLHYALKMSPDEVNSELLRAGVLPKQCQFSWRSTESGESILTLEKLLS